MYQSYEMHVHVLFFVRLPGICSVLSININVTASDFGPFMFLVLLLYER